VGIVQTYATTRIGRPANKPSSTLGFRVSQLVQRRCSAVAHPPKYPDYAGQLLDYLLPLPPQSPPIAVVPTVDEQALDRILAKVGKKFIPDNLNRMALWTAIKQADDDKKSVNRFRSGARTRAIVKSMKRISKTAESLAAAVKQNDDATQLVAQMLPLALTTTAELIILATHVEQVLNESSVALRARYDRIPSANEWLAGIELPLIFEDFFYRNPGRSRVNDKPGGPTVRFIAAVMREIDSQLAEETIVRAMTRFSELRKRRQIVRRRNSNIGQK